MRNEIRSYLSNDAGTRTLPPGFEQITDDRVENRLGELMLLIANHPPGGTGFSRFRTELEASWNSGFERDLNAARGNGNLESEARLLLFLARTVKRGSPNNVNDDNAAYAAWQRAIAQDYCQCQDVSNWERNPAPADGSWYKILDNRRKNAPLPGQRLTADYLFMIFEAILNNGNQIGTCPTGFP